MTLKHNQYGVLPHVNSVATGANKFVENKLRTMQIGQNTPIKPNQMEDAEWHRSKSARFQQN